MQINQVRARGPFWTGQVKQSTSARTTPAMA